jgi:transcriptional regulator with XRE-family HTH domain
MSAKCGIFGSVHRGITTGSYARIELGQSSPAWATVRQIADALGVSMADLSAAVERES